MGSTDPEKAYRSFLLLNKKYSQKLKTLEPIPELDVCRLRCKISGGSRRFSAGILPYGKGKQRRAAENVQARCVRICVRIILG